VIKGTSEFVGIVFQSFQKMANILIGLRISLHCGEEENNKTKHTHCQQLFSHNYLLSESSVTL